MTENFRPITHHSPDSFFARIKFYLRMILDFQFASIYRHLKPEMALFKGKVLDIGAGNSPFKHLLKNDSEYFGIDIKNSENFDYVNNNIKHYDGKIIPFENETFNNIICTEVLEHIEYPELLISETLRVLKPSGVGIFTIPWSARFHYQPYDYHRYTPSMLKLLFQDFSSIEITERGTDVASIVSKIIVLYFRNLTSIIYDKFDLIKIIKNILVSILLLPFLIVGIPIGMLGVYGLIGSKDDPLGYTLIIKK